MKFVDVTNDIAFRKIFGNEHKKQSLISFLNAVIKFPDGELITEVEILNPYQLPKLEGGKSTILDVKAKNNKGNTFIVEMQIAESEFFHKRILYYTSQSYVGQIDKGKDYQKLSPAYFIGILEFGIGNNPSYFSCHKVLDVETGEQIIRDVEFYFIELPKFDKLESQLVSNIDQWTYFIKNAENLNVIPETVKDLGLVEAYIQADKHSWTSLELDDYERASIKEQDDIGRLSFAEKKGFKIGIEEGVKSVAINLIKLGLTNDIIANATGLSQNEINQLR